MKYKNILLTGERNCGKSTLINKILEDNKIDYSGYRTLPYYINEGEQGYYIQGYVDYIEKEKIYGAISIKLGEKKYVRVTETFDELGVYILRKSRIEDEKDFILLDEIGFLEDKSETFKEEIYRCLECEKFCLGVLKLRDTEFLNSIKEREDTLVINIEDISYEDRRIVKREIENYINLYRLQGEN